MATPTGPDGFRSAANDERREMGEQTCGGILPESREVVQPGLEVTQDHETVTRSTGSRGSPGFP